MVEDWTTCAKCGWVFPPSLKDRTHPTLCPECRDQRKYSLSELADKLMHLKQEDRNDPARS